MPETMTMCPSAVPSHFAYVFLALAFAASAGSENIALHRPYTWSKAPNYGLCRDDGDATQLTDGAVGHDGEALWRQRSTVGWVRPGGPVSITIDLGAVYSIGG